MNNKVFHIFLFWTVTVCRILLAGTFLFSGFVKAVDPVGMSYKLSAYFTYWGFSFAENSLLLFLLTVLLSTVEFVLGVHLLLGIRKRFAVAVTAIFMTAMTGLTVYIYMENSISDCGCFGEALTLTNGETLLKNIVLWGAALLLCWKKRYVLRIISERNQWITSLYSYIYIILLSIYTFHYLPPLDFTPYKVGTDLREACLNVESGENIGSVPEELMAFYLCDAKSGEDFTETVLNDSGRVFLLTFPDLNTADDGNNDRINDLFDVCQDAGYGFYGVVGAAADSSALSHWTDQTGAAYPFLQSDDTALKALVRSNPGLLLIHDGRIVAKWSNNNLPESVISGQGEAKADAFSQQPLVELLLWFIVPLFFIISLDRLWIGSIFLRHHKYKKRLKQKVMRKKIVAGNWKMNKNLQEGVALAKELNTMLTADKPACDVVICTPFIHLASVAAELNEEIIGLGAENCADKASGAYTGEVSAEMVKSTGAQYVILGHSERRAYYHETAEILKEKINLALSNGLKVIFCIGEVLEERESGKQNEVVKAQLEGSLFDLSAEEFSNIILAYEPVWAIGTGKTATAEQAEEMHAFIRNVISEKFGAEAAENVSILYGGSCKPSNAKEIFSKPNVDGGLIGGAALKAEDFKGIIDAWK